MMTEFIYSDLRPYMTHHNIRGGILWARFVQCQILTPVSRPHPERAPYKKKCDFKGAPWQILCTVPRIPSDGPGCRQEWLLSVWGVLLLAVIMKIAVVIYSRHLNGWRGLRLVLKGKKQTPSIYLNASMLARIIRDPASSTEEVITCFF